MDVKLKLEDLRQVGAKHPQFWADALTLGVIEGADLRLQQSDFDRLNLQHFGAAGLGNLVHWLVHPVAKVLGIDDCDDCAARRMMMNTWGFKEAVKTP